MRTMSHLVAGKKDQFLGLEREKVSRLIEKANMKRVMIDREHICVYTSSLHVKISLTAICYNHLSVCVWGGGSANINAAALGE